MFALFVELNTKPDTHQRVDDLLRAMVATADAEPGVVVYAVNRPAERPDTFLLYELYRTRGDCEAHLQLPVIADALAQFETLLASPPNVTFCESAYLTAIR